MSFIENFNYNKNQLVTDDFSNDADHGYSLFNLNRNPNQYVIDVVDVGTNTTGSYTAKDLEDGTLLAAVGETGLVSKIYDQFGGKHASAYLNNTGIMPYIITGGEFVTLDGLPAMIFNSGNRNAYLNIKTAGFDNSEPVDLSTHILGVDGIEAFATVSLDENSIYNSTPYKNSYIFGENYNGARKDYALGFHYSNANRLTLYVERGTNNNFTRGSIAGDTDDTRHGYAYTGEIVTLGETYIINSFSKLDEDNGSGIVGFGTGQNYTSGYVVTGRDNYIVGSIGSDETYDDTFKGRFQEVLFYTSLRDDRDVIYSEIQQRRSNGLNGLASTYGTISPSYGSSISFKANNSQWYGSSYYHFIAPNGANSIKAEMDLKFQGGIQKIQNVLKRLQEATTGPITGNEAFSGVGNFINFGEYVNPIQINLDTDYYQNFSGSQVTNFNIRHIASDVYELGVSVFNNRVSPVLNNGMGFVADRTVSIDDSSFLKFDVATGSTGSANSEVFNNYFYLTGFRDSSISATNVSGLSTYTGFADDATRTFFWEPDQQVSISIDHSARINQFKRSFHQQLNISDNQNKIGQLQLRFSNRGEKETYSILHFLESHLGYKQFVYYYDDPIIKQDRVFYCPEWTHTFNYKDSNTIEAKFVEITSPVIPQF